MTIKKATLVFGYIFIASAVLAQIDPGPDGIGIYFDEGASQVSATVSVGETVEAYLIATNLSQTGTLALWVAGVSPEGAGPYPAIVVGDPVNGFNMSTNMPGNPSYSFAVSMDFPFPNLQPTMILATLEITVLEDGPIGLLIFGNQDDGTYYLVNDLSGPATMLYPSSGNSAHPVAMLNGPAPVANELDSWGGVKSLYRLTD